ncbi:MAG TPA: CPBP family intramembrane metalloprotease [Fimbriimonadaceae bacterium]|nr:CPBP family intramembrane metalloprotease [Fimbriimonadaceae bacterium]
MRAEEEYGVLGRREQWIRIEVWMIVAYMGCLYVVPGIFNLFRFGPSGFQSPQASDTPGHLGLLLRFRGGMWLSGDHPSMFGFVWPRLKEVLTWTLILVVIVFLERLYFLNRLDWFGFQPAEQAGVLLTLVTLFGLALMSATYEEILIRGLLQTRLNELYGPGLAVGGSSAVFAVAHISYGVNGVFFALITGLVLGIGRSRGGSLLTLSVAPAAWNTCIYFFWRSVVPAPPL